MRTKWILEFPRRDNPVLIAREHDVIVTALDSGNSRSAARLLATHAGRLVAHLRAAAAEAPVAESTNGRSIVPKLVRKNSKTNP